MKSEKGVTLVALVITIIVMLILAGVTIDTVINGGIIDQAREAARLTETAIIKEKLLEGIVTARMENDLTEDRLKEILEEEGTIIYKEDGKTIKGIKTKDKEYEILLIDIWEGTIDEGQQRN